MHKHLTRRSGEVALATPICAVKNVLNDERIVEVKRKPMLRHAGIYDLCFAQVRNELHVCCDPGHL